MRRDVVDFMKINERNFSRGGSILYDDEDADEAARAEYSQMLEDENEDDGDDEDSEEEV